jgi:phosphoserine phosphatase
VLSSQAAVAIQRARLLEERIVKERLERDLALAREIQESALPRRLPTVSGYSLAARARPASETGGDVYDLARLGDRGEGPLLLLLADATGHGVGPALSAMQALGMLRVGLRLGARLDGLVRQVNAQLAEDLGRGRFVTAFVGLLRPDAHRVEYHAAGQAPLLLWRRAAGACETLPATTIPLGVLADLPADPHATVELAPGDLLCLLTDGFFEAAGTDGEPLGAAPLRACLAELSDRPVAEILGRLFALVDDRLAGRPQADDLTAVLLRRERGP